MTTVHIVLNPASGVPGLSRTLHGSHIAPLLQQQQQHAPALRIATHETTCEGDGVRVGREVRCAARDGPATGTVYAVLLGGDGTTHEFLNGFIQAGEDADDGKSAAEEEKVTIELAVVPTGTANALYAGLYPPGSTEAAAEGADEHAWRLRSVKALLRSLQHGSESAPAPAPASDSTLVPLTLTLASTRPAQNSEQNSSPPRSLLAHIVTSHALHAAILHDSEALRAEHPGIERFKIAAQQNATKWVSGTLRLLRPPGAGVQRYDPATDRFVEVDGNGKDTVDIEGPFLYLTALSTDRLEPHFVPGPFSTTETLARAAASSSPSSSSPSNSHPRPPSALDIVAIRPLQSPAVRAALTHAQLTWDSDAAQGVRTQFALGALTTVTQQMYDGGRHVRLTYPAAEAEGEASSEPAAEAVQGESLAERGRGSAVVDYFRAAGYEWAPADGDTHAQLTCVDGTVLRSSSTSVSVLQAWADKVGVWR